VTTQAVLDTARAVRSDVARAVETAAVRSGVNFSYLLAQAGVESGFRPDAKASTSSAEGLYQFLKGTWLEVVKEHGPKHGLGSYAKALESGTVDGRTEKQILALRRDPKVAALMAAEYARENREHLQQNVGGRLADVDLYLAHFLGPNGAEKFLKAHRAQPGRAAADFFPDAAEANRAVFYDQGRARSLDEVRKLFANKLEVAQRGPTGAPPNKPFLPEGARPRNAVPEVVWIQDGAPMPMKLAPATQLLLLTLNEIDAEAKRASFL
jgi:hypothetical protein